MFSHPSNFLPFLIRAATRARVSGLGCSRYHGTVSGTKKTHFDDFIDKANSSMTPISASPTASSLSSSSSGSAKIITVPDDYIKPDDRNDINGDNNNDINGGESRMAPFFHSNSSNSVCMQRPAEWGKVPAPPTTPYAHLPTVRVLFAKNNIHCVFRNPEISLIWGFSLGQLGFQNSHKKAPSALHEFVVTLARKLARPGMEKYGVVNGMIRMEVKGFNVHRSNFFNQLRKFENQIKVMELMDVTGIPDNGCKPPNPRRI
jgi:small subunit ribosomal protein S11